MNLVNPHYENRMGFSQRIAQRQRQAKRQGKEYVLSPEELEYVKRRRPDKYPSETVAAFVEKITVEKDLPFPSGKYRIIVAYWYYFVDVVGTEKHVFYTCPHSKTQCCLTVHAFRVYKPLKLYDETNNTVSDKSANVRPENVTGDSK